MCASGRSHKPSLSSPDYAGSSLAVHCLCLPCRSYICHPGSSRSLPSFCEGPFCSCALRFEHTSAESVTGKKLLLPLTSPGTMGVFRIPISPQTPAQDSVSQFGGGMWSRKRRHGQKRSRRPRGWTPRTQKTKCLTINMSTMTQPHPDRPKPDNCPNPLKSVPRPVKRRPPALISPCGPVRKPTTWATAS